MAWKVYDYECLGCHHFEPQVLVDDRDDPPACPSCSCRMARHQPAPITFGTIAPTHTNSKKNKAGYQHLHVNRPASKTQVGYGGSVSADHPTGGGKPQQS